MDYSLMWSLFPELETPQPTQKKVVPFVPPKPAFVRMVYQSYDQLHSKETTQVVTEILRELQKKYPKHTFAAYLFSNEPKTFAWWTILVEDIKFYMEDTEFQSYSNDLRKKATAINAKLGYACCARPVEGAQEHEYWIV